MKPVVRVLAVTAFLFTVSHPVRAADMSCAGNVVLVMADNNNCNGHLAFKSSGAGGAAGPWMCTKSALASSTVLTALASGKPTVVYIDNAGAPNCSSLPHYRQISYILVEQ